MIDLKPCPYCGEDASVARIHPTESFFAYCLNACLTTAAKESEEEAADAWNEAVDAINAYRRTCTVKHRREKSDCFLTVLSCGHEFVDFTTRIPNFCPECGARVVGE